MEAHAAVERDQVAVEIVEHLNTRTRLREEDGESPCERLDVAGVVTDFRQDVFEEAAFAARPCDGGLYAVFGLDLSGLNGAPLARIDVRFALEEGGF
jgi:hypothetical protein